MHLNIQITPITGMSSYSDSGSCYSRSDSRSSSPDSGHRHLYTPPPGDYNTGDSRSSSPDSGHRHLYTPPPGDSEEDSWYSGEEGSDEEGDIESDSEDSDTSDHQHEYNKLARNKTSESDDSVCPPHFAKLQNCRMYGHLTKK
jgi:hypothetical protein